MSTTPTNAVTQARALQRALLARHDSPRPTSASCRPATPAQIGHGPFGRSAHPQFTCQLTVAGNRARYDVQIQPNGCYVAERHRPGQSIYGCGVRGSGG